MYIISVFFFALIGLQIGVVAELDASSCSLLRTGASLTNIIPEVAQLAMRYYRVSSSSDQHHRQKRFLFSDTSNGSAPKGSVLEQMIANAFKDVNFTRVAHLILNNNETMAKIRQNVDGNAILRAAMREIDYEKLGSSLWYGAEAEFDLEYIISSIVNFTHIDTIYEQVVINGTLSDSLIKSFHPDLNVQTVQRMFNSLKNLTHKFDTTLNSSEQLENYLFNSIQQHVLTPMTKIIQKVKSENPTTLDELVEIILDNVNKVVMEQFSTTTKKPPTPSKSKANPSTTTIAPLEDQTSDDVKLLLYQCSITIESIGKTAHSLLKSFEQLYCTSIWD